MWLLRHQGKLASAANSSTVTWATKKHKDIRRVSMPSCAFCASLWLNDYREPGAGLRGSF